MKVQKSKAISAFGGINFVFEYLEENTIGDALKEKLPELGPQSEYSWKDIFYSLLSIYLCGGDCVEDLQTHLKGHFIRNPFIKIPSPDTVLRRFSHLAQDNVTCRTKRGNVDHSYNTNTTLEQLNIKILDILNVFDQEELILDYDNTIIFNEKSDSRMTYKRNPGYQPGVCTINEEQILYVENRNGHSDAKSFQSDTLARLFDMLSKNNIKKADHFRADAASYQYDVVKLLDEQVKYFYIGCKNSYVEKYFTKATNWTKMTSSDQKEVEVGELIIKPFKQRAKSEGHTPKEYRLIVKRSLKNNRQLDVFTNDAYEYRAILSNNFELSAEEIAQFYNHRGNMERQFDILKNDFGWDNMPFSTLGKNTVFLYLTAICRNLYHGIINHFSKKCQELKPYYRVKKFLFRFIILPAKWVEHARQLHLRVFGEMKYCS